MGVSLRHKHDFGFEDLPISGNLLFEPPGSGKGLLYGCIHVKDNSGATTLNDTAKVQITVFDSDCPSNGILSVHGENHLVINSPGVYLIAFTVHVNNNAAQTHVIDISVWKNNGATELTEIHAHRTLEGGSGDIGSMAGTGIVALVAGDTVEMWADTDITADRSVTFTDVSLSVLKVGG